MYAIRIPLFEGSFNDIYSLIVDKCADSLNFKVSSFWKSIKEMGVDIPLVGGFTVSTQRVLSILQNALVELNLKGMKIMLWLQVHTIYFQKYRSIRILQLEFLIHMN